MNNTMYAKVLRYDQLRTQKNIIDKEMKSLAEEIKVYASTHGAKDSKGSYYVDDGGDFVYGQQAKTSLKLNADKTLEYAKSHGLDCIDKVEVLNEEKFEQYISNGTVDVDTLESLTDKKTTYAVSVIRREDMPEVEEAAIEPSKNTASGKKKVLKVKKRG